MIRSFLNMELNWAYGTEHDHRYGKEKKEIKHVSSIRGTPLRNKALQGLDTAIFTSSA